ncbi:type IV secretion system protein VirB2 [Xanthomonas arboricola]|uniref:TrbC/VirB2 family protein n=1 Tax=Xanthomonas sp. 3793 TaxID=3035312 RepID=UPI0021697475|nr:TrbC/VirB2 family protein [Xanthomonas sp. 3793]MCS3745070.1 type IV secretion system protein VirB2 [Xanthomonas sp. 3793]
MKHAKLTSPEIQRTVKTVFKSAIFVAALSASSAFAQNFGGTDTKTCEFFTSITGLLNIASIAVVTIAVIFAGYQIAFAHKRIGDVAPILIGGVLIGAAGQIARMLLGTGAGGSCGAVNAFVTHSLPFLTA